MKPSKPRIEQLTVGSDPAPWREAGFEVGNGTTAVGELQLAFADGEGLLGWRLTSIETEIDGLPVTPASPTKAPSATHPNGVTRIDHIGVFTPDLERTTSALAEIDVERRRVREAESSAGTLRQGFFRLGEVILEVVEHARVEPGPARFWGITFAVADLDTCAELLRDRLGSIHDAVQPG